MAKTAAVNKKYRDVFGEISYELGHFFVPHRAVNGKYSILKREPYYVTDAYVLYDGIFLWDKAPVFDSWIQAVRFLKENVLNMM